MELSLGLEQGKLQQKWTELSGGQRQRAIIGCGLLLASCLQSVENVVNDGTKRGDSCPCVLLMDEPTAACDSETTQLVEQTLVEAGCAIIMITHDDRQSLRIAHKRIILSLNSDSPRS